MFGVKFMNLSRILFTCRYCSLTSGSHSKIMSQTTKEDIKTIAVIDLETNGLPWQQKNTCAITELSIYAFSADCLKDGKEDEIVLQLNDDMDIIEKLSVKPPELPRVLHKITMMINPEKMIDPVAAKMSGLTNDMLHNETPFDLKTANCLLMFLERLEKPVCFVAHNGWSFDYPIIRYVFEIIDVAIPSSIYCIDSFKAFREIDEKQSIIEELREHLQDKGKSLDLTETAAADSEKRLLALNSYRQIFSEPFKPKTRFPKKGTYVLGNIFERIFQHPAADLHRAEADVEILTQLILHYGLVFLACAEERKRSFAEVSKLGSRTD